MSNKARPSSVEVVRTKVSRFLAQCSFLPPDTKPQIEDAVASALTVWSEEQKERVRRWRRASARKWYWNKRKAIIEQVEGIARNSIVLSPPTITFRDFETCLCPHGWNWDYCEALGQRLISLREAPPGAPNAYRWDLRKAHINPDTARVGEDVCAPGTREQHPPSQHPIPPNGRPPNTVEKYLLQTIVPCLKQAGWTYVKSCDFLALLLIHSFGRKTKSRAALAYNLDRQRRSLNRSHSLT